ncbi:hypothetical protein FHS51_003368 [Sphingobium wenxiniae]|uniref:DUF6884 domain-containing protein n=1 Tax=Sphingobium wenxiniae (strain DSM 21828 / CGMCC 1.7748 / JZ-1) TaxID=595605 RepID=A0A562K4W4_SPHWJ|nr:MULTISPECIES: DUF6884 domain-containing protein [Sphingobium]MBB6193112.1 hypothetical protein [Sphingobium wenxiniae]TWH90255.1 hypothetical protein IQ35_03538 [Sphingobium wenxiniae]|tara:strand:+ start:38268 stop:38729 length:462 start_codon:yes stop_codon:yes gene_type:complete
MTRPVHLVACVAEKRPRATRARDLYQSDWFRKARAYVDTQGGRWFILSALHGALSPGRIIEPYNVSLATMTAADRRAWGERVAAQLAEQIGPRTPVVFLAGRLYRDPLADWAGSRASVPMRGLGIGQQKAWLATQTRDARDRAAQLDLFDDWL